MSFDRKNFFSLQNMKKCLGMRSLLRDVTRRIPWKTIMNLTHKACSLNRVTDHSVCQCATRPLHHVPIMLLPHSITSKALWIYHIHQTLQAYSNRLQNGRKCWCTRFPESFYLLCNVTYYMTLKTSWNKNEVKLKNLFLCNNKQDTFL